MKNLILYFFLLVLRVFFNLILDDFYKRGRFVKTLIEKSSEYILFKVNNLILLNLSLILLLAEINPIIKKQSWKKNVLMAFITSCIKMVLALLTKIVALYIQVFIIQIRIFDFEMPILE